jgi:hypothetical protein
MAVNKTVSIGCLSSFSSCTRGNEYKNLIHCGAWTFVGLQYCRGHMGNPREGNILHSVDAVYLPVVLIKHKMLHIRNPFQACPNRAVHIKYLYKLASDMCGLIHYTVAESIGDSQDKNSSTGP